MTFDFRNYSLSWPNKQKWSIIIAEDVAEIFEPLLSISELFKIETTFVQSLIIHKKKNNSKNSDPLLRLPRALSKSLPKKNWYKNTFTGGCFWINPDVSDVICELDNDIQKKVQDKAKSKYKNPAAIKYKTEIWKYNCLFVPIFQQAHLHHGLWCHAAMVGYKDTNILLSAPSDVGKSTAFRRLPDQWKKYCDDNVMIFHQRETNTYCVHPILTWSNQIHSRSEEKINMQHSVPLNSIFFLEQSSNDSVVPLKKGEIASRLFQSVSDRTFNFKSANLPEPPNYFEKTCDTISQLAKDIPGYILQISLTGKFWEEIKKVL